MATRVETRDAERELEQQLPAAYARLDAAWRSGVGVDQALADLQRLTGQLGRHPAIDQAKMVLADKHDCEPSQAFRILVERSQRTNRKLRDVAMEIVETERSSRGR